MIYNGQEEGTTFSLPIFTLGNVINGTKTKQQWKNTKDSRDLSFFIYTETCAYHKHNPERIKYV